MDSRNLPPPTFDLEQWVSNYDGILLPFRLIHVANHCPSLAYQSLALAIAIAKRGKDINLFTRLHQLAAKMKFTDLSNPDMAWVSRQEETNRRDMARLESELRGYKNNLIRESIRMGQEDIATHLLQTGGPPQGPENSPAAGITGYNAAFIAFGKVREYCTTPSHIASMTTRLIFSGIVGAFAFPQNRNSKLQYFNSVIANCQHLSTLGVTEEESAKILPIVNVAKGIAHMSLGAYSEAADSFLVTSSEYVEGEAVHSMDFTKLLASGNDVAIYGGLCALATMTRDELIVHVLEGPFRTFLELEPHMRKAITLYTTARYQACLATLKRYTSDWTLDIYLGADSGSDGASHVQNLFTLIRQRSIIAYVSTFAEISLSSLAVTFPPAPSTTSTTPEQAMESELLLLIRSRALDARLDVVNGVLVTPRVQLRSKAQTDAMSAAEDIERSLLLRLHRVNMTLAGLQLTRPNTTLAAT